MRHVNRVMANSRLRAVDQAETAPNAQVQGNTPYASRALLGILSAEEFAANRDSHRGALQCHSVTNFPMKTILTFNQRQFAGIKARKAACCRRWGRDHAWAPRPEVSPGQALG